MVTIPTHANKGRASAGRWIRRNFNALNQILGVLAAVGFIGVVIRILTGPRGLDLDYVGSNFFIVFDAMSVGATVTTIAYVSGIVIGFLIGWIRANAAMAKRGPGRGWVPWLLKQGAARLCYGYVEIMRGTPIFVQIFFVWSVFTIYYFYLGAGPIAFYAGIVALTLNTGAYQGEIFRGGLQAVHHGQIEAARAIGLSRLATMRYVTLPQAIRLILPPLTNEFIGLLKASSLLYTVGLQEATYWGVDLAQRSLKVFEVFAMVTASYLLVTLPLAWAVKYMERRLRIPGLGIQEEPERGRDTRPGTSATVRNGASLGARVQEVILTSSEMQRIFTGRRHRPSARGIGRPWRT
jgi:His/Glu/Gln/Arg/opine family amino acid ABC transporter permease subunit